MFQTLRRAAPLSALLLLVGCGGAIDTPAADDDGGADATADTASSETYAPPDAGPDTAVDTGASPDDGIDSAPTDTGDVDSGPIDTGELDTGDLDTGLLDTGTLDTGSLDTGVDAPADGGPVDCSTFPLAVDPAATDPTKDGPLTVGHQTFVVPKLNTLTDVNVRVTYPTAPDGSAHPGKHAWVMFHHAVYRSFPGVVYDKYDRIFDRWASHGFIVFSIDGARVFYPTPSGTGLTWTQQNTVAEMMSQAITYFLERQTHPSFDLACRLDPSRLAVSGHSRGGGAALLVPTARTDGATIKGYVGFQPVDPNELSPPAGSVIPGFDIPGLWLDSALDGDVIYPISALQYSASRGRATHVTILGSKHTFTFDDPTDFPTQGGTPPTITPDEHKAVCNQYSVAFLRARVRDATPDPTDLDRIFGATGMTSTASSGDVLIRWKTPSSSTWLARFDEPIPGGPGKTDAGAAITTEGSVSADSFETYASSTSTMGAGSMAVSRTIRSVKLSWTTTAGGAMVVPLPALGLSGKKAITFETSLPDGPLSGATSPLMIEVVDSTGAKASLAVKDYVGTGFIKRSRRLSIAFVPVEKLTGIDVAKAISVRLVVPAGAAAGDTLIDTMRIE